MLLFFFFASSSPFSNHISESCQQNWNDTHTFSSSAEGIYQQHEFFLSLSRLPNNLDVFFSLFFFVPCVHLFYLVAAIFYFLICDYFVDTFSLQRFFYFRSDLFFFFGHFRYFRYFLFFFFAIFVIFARSPWPFSLQRLDLSLGWFDVFVFLRLDTFLDISRHKRPRDNLVLWVKNWKPCYSLDNLELPGYELKPSKN